MSTNFSHYLRLAKIREASRQKSAAPTSNAPSADTPTSDTTSPDTTMSDAVSPDTLMSEVPFPSVASQVEVAEAPSSLPASQSQVDVEAATPPSATAHLSQTDREIVDALCSLRSAPVERSQKRARHPSMPNGYQEVERKKLKLWDEEVDNGKRRGPAFVITAEEFARVVERIEPQRRAASGVTAPHQLPQQPAPVQSANMATVTRLGKAAPRPPATPPAAPPSVATTPTVPALPSPVPLALPGANAPAAPTQARTAQQQAVEDHDTFPDDLEAALGDAMGNEDPEKELGRWKVTEPGLPTNPGARKIVAQRFFTALEPHRTRDWRFTKQWVILQSWRLENSIYNVCKNGSSLPKHCDPAMDKVQHKNKSKCYFKYKDAEKIGRNLAYSERVDEVINALKNAAVAKDVLDGVKNLEYVVTAAPKWPAKNKEDMKKNNDGRKERQGKQKRSQVGQQVIEQQGADVEVDAEAGAQREVTPGSAPPRSAQTDAVDGETTTTLPLHPRGQTTRSPRAASGIDVADNISELLDDAQDDPQDKKDTA